MLYLSVYLSIHPSIHLSMYLSISFYLSICLSAVQHPQSTTPATKSALQGPQKVLRLPRNLHSKAKAHKVLHLPPILHFHIHKVLHLPRNVHCKVHKVLRLPRSTKKKTAKNKSKLSRGPLRSVSKTGRWNIDCSTCRRRPGQMEMNKVSCMRMGRMTRSTNRVEKPVRLKATNFLLDIEAMKPIFVASREDGILRRLLVRSGSNSHWRNCGAGLL